jgi:hypothetical protein
MKEVLGAVDVLQEPLQFYLKPVVPLDVVRLVMKLDLARGGQGHAVIGMGQILGGQPEVE